MAALIVISKPPLGFYAPTFPNNGFIFVVKNVIIA